MNLESFCQRHGLPAVYAEFAGRYFLPFADWLEGRVAEHSDGAYVLGLNGAQGTGKSTLAALLSEYLAAEYDRNVVVLSIDDIYLGREERLSLGKRIHPLLSTRGVPGTHDIELGIRVIKRLKSMQAGESFSIPRFDKSRDDRFPRSDWGTVTGAVDLVIFEGWCVASQSVPDAELDEPINALEASADSDGRWRNYVNNRLRTDYAQLFELLDGLLFLKAPCFDAVLRWRLEQEHKLRQNAAANADAIMSDEQVATFIQHYERITRQNIALLPSIADAVIGLANDHAAISLTYRQ